MNVLGAKFQGILISIMFLLVLHIECMRSVLKHDHLHILHTSEEAIMRFGTASSGSVAPQTCVVVGASIYTCCECEHNHTAKNLEQQGAYYQSRSGCNQFPLWYCTLYSFLFRLVCNIRVHNNNCCPHFYPFHGIHLAHNPDLQPIY